MKKIIVILLLVTLFATGCNININEQCDCDKQTNNNTNTNNENNNTKKNEKDLIGKEFTRTYNINHIAESNNYDYLYITIREFQAEEIETVKVNRSDFKTAEVGDNYEITFKINNNDIEDNIKSIFECSEIISAKKTNKTGLEQISEDFD